MFQQVLHFGSEMISYLLHTLYADGLYLFLSILIAVSITVYVDSEKIRKLFVKKSRFMILGSVGFGALTPLCACGTMAVVISLLTTALPWAPIMAFLVSSPLMSPDTFVLIMGFMGINFAVALTLSSLILGLAAGYITHKIEIRTSFFNSQLRLNTAKVNVNVCNECEELRGVLRPSEFQNNLRMNAANLKPIVITRVADSSLSICCEPEKETNRYSAAQLYDRLKISLLLKNFLEIGVVKILPIFSLFVLLAYIIKTFVPETWIINLFGSSHFYSVPLAAIISLPLYVSDATVVPLLQVLRDAGASNGAMLAFMIAGPGTSLGVIAGLNLIMKRKAILLYTGLILGGAIILGYLYDLYFFLM
jgi:uncharacterized membrane protein YraQ (UPF0718 family)